jgi:hypothetical protein
VNRNVLGVYYSPWREHYDHQHSLLELYRSAVRNKANPRSEAYMQALFAERWPEGEFVNAKADPAWAQRLPAADTVVLLFPDAIGIGFAALEAEVRKRRKVWATVRALNGRRRDFVLSRSVRRQLAFRRLLERSMATEVLATFCFFIATPFLLGYDLVRGHR